MTEREREELVVNYMPLANKIAWAKRKTTPICITIDELKSAAYMGLVEAASRFDPARGVAFGVFARMRIAGEITDYLRTFKWSSKMISLDFSQVLSDTLEYKIKEVDFPNEFFDKVTKHLSAIERRIIRMYYMEDKSLKEIGLQEGISESRVSQILKKCRQQIARIHKLTELHDFCVAN